MFLFAVSMPVRYLMNTRRFTYGVLPVCRDIQIPSLMWQKQETAFID